MEATRMDLDALMLTLFQLQLRTWTPNLDLQSIPGIASHYGPPLRYSIFVPSWPRHDAACAEYNFFSLLQ